MAEEIKRERINNEWVRTHIPPIEVLVKTKKPSKTWEAAQKNKNAIIVYDKTLFED